MLNSVIARSVSDKAISLNPGMASSLSLLAVTHVHENFTVLGARGNVIKLRKFPFVVSLSNHK